MRSSKVAATVVTGVVVALGASSALAAGTPAVPRYDGTPGPGDLQARPASIIYSGDGSAFLAGARKGAHRHGRLDWKSWTATGARGSGYDWLDNCRPDCAGGKFSAYPVKLHAFRPERVQGHLIFTRLRMTYTGRLPSRRSPRTQVFSVTHRNGGFYWGFTSH